MKKNSKKFSQKIKDKEEIKKIKNQELLWTRKKKLAN